MEAVLIIVHEEGRPPEEHRIAGNEVVFGRSPSCDIVLDRPFVSGRHLRVLGGVVAHDLGSTNGSFIDGVPLDRPEWIDGRKIALGGNELWVEIRGDEPVLPKTIEGGEYDDNPSTAPIDLITDAFEDSADDRDAKPAIETPPRPVTPRRQPVNPEEQPGSPEPAPKPIPKRQSAQPVDDEGAAALLARLIQTDARNEEPRVQAALPEFFTLESFRFMRDVETIVSRMAGELAGNSTDETILPSAGGNVMRHLADIQAVPDDAFAREQFLDHLAEVRRWLVEALTAYQRASVRLVEDIRSSLGMLELARAEPMPKVHKALGLQDMVLWKRAQKRLQDLTPDVIAERLDEFAREAARAAIQNRD